jgi:hypothetical protein
MQHDVPLRAGLWALAGVQLATGLWLVASPSTFYSAIADFGARNTHDLRDISAFYLASAVVLAISTARPSWRAPVLALVGVQYVLHTIGHVFDSGKADPSWVGPFDVATLAIGVVLIGGLYREASR